jgi:hypothetical protein
MKRPLEPDLMVPIIENPFKRICKIGYIKQDAQTITMTLKHSLHPNNSNKVISKLNVIIPYMSSVTKILGYYFNWYSNEYEQLFPLPPKNARNHIELMMKVILGQKDRIRQKTLLTYPDLFKTLDRFLNMYPNFQLKCPIEIHQSMMNLAGETIVTNLNLYHLQFLDHDYLNNQFIKCLTFKIREQIEDPKEYRKAINDILTPSLKKDISTTIKLKLKEIQKKR